MYTNILEKLKEIHLFIKHKIIPLILSARLWLTLLFISICVVLCSKYYISFDSLYGITFYKIDYCILLTIIFLSGILSYTVFSYICDLKTVYKKSTSDILLTSIFVAMLFIPASHIDKNQTNYKESRSLTKFSQLFTDSKINNNFGKDFEKWFNDRFYLRDNLIDLYRTIQKSINIIYRDNKVLADKRSGWFFLNKEIENTYKIPYYPDLYLITKNLNKFNDFCELNNIKMYFVIIPERASIYREFIPTEYLKSRRTYGEKVNDYLNQNNDDNFSHLFPMADILNAKKQYNELLYYKTDCHQTDLGGYITYLALMELIKKDFPEIQTTTLNDYYIKKNKMINTGESELVFHLGNVNEISLKDAKFLNYENTYYYPKNTNIMTEEYDNPHLLKNRSYNPDGKRKVILLGSSFVEKINLFIKSSFKYTDKIRLNTAYEKNFHVSRFADYIKKEKPDVLIVIISEGELFDYISTMYNDNLELEP